MTQPHYIKGRKIDCKIAIPKEHLAIMNNTSTKDNDKDKDTTKSRHNNNSNSSNSNSNSKSKTTKRTFTPVTPVNNANITHNTPPMHNESDDNTYFPHIQNQIQYTSSTATHSPLPANNSTNTSSSSSPSLPSSSSSSSSLLYLRKIFVGGLPPQLTTETLVNFFSKFGPIEKGMIMTDKYTGKKRGFGFLIFSHKETVDKIMSTSNCYCLCGKWIECKRAYPREQQQMTTLNESNTNPSTSSNSDNDNDNYVVNDKSQSQCSNESNLFMYQNYIPKSQIKFFNIINVNNSNESLIDQQNQFININSSNNNNQQHSQQQQQFQFYFNNCITNPSYQQHFRYKLFDKNGEDLSELMLYKNSQKTTLFTEETQLKMNNTIYNSNTNTNNSSPTLLNIHKQPIDYVYYDINKQQMSNQSWIGNYFMNNTNNTSTNHSKSINPIVNYYTNINSTYTNNTNLIIPSDINNNKPHQQLINNIDNTNTTINISNNNEVDVSSDFVDEHNGSCNDNDCYGPNIQKRKLYNQNTFNDSYRPY